MLNLDTHILVYACLDALTPKEKSLVLSEPCGISAIVLWELAKLSEKKRISLDFDDPDLMLALERLHIWPITIEICHQLKKLDFRSDPADELIATTSLVHQIPLLTRDQRIRNSKIVPLA